MSFSNIAYASKAGTLTQGDMGGCTAPAAAVAHRQYQWGWDRNSFSVGSGVRMGCRRAPPPGHTTTPASHQHVHNHDHHCHFQPVTAASQYNPLPSLITLIMSHHRIPTDSINRHRDTCTHHHDHGKRHRRRRRRLFRNTSTTTGNCHLSRLTAKAHSCSARSHSTSAPPWARNEPVPPQPGAAEARLIARNHGPWHERGRPRQPER